MDYLRVSSLAGGVLVAFLTVSAWAAPEFTRLDIAVAPEPIAVAAHDFDVDGDLDLAVVNATAPAGLTILLNDGHAHFTISVHYPLPAGMTEPTDVVGADFDGDGDIDLAETVAYAGGTNFSVVRLFTNSGGVFAQTQVQVGYGPNCIVTGDINGDARPDLATANYLANGWTMLFNNGIGGFTASTRIIQPNPRAINLGDIDGDGDLDVVLTWLHGMVVGFNSGAGLFPTGDLYNFGLRPDSIAFVDFDRDGDLDLAITDYVDETLYIFGNNGAGAFSISTSYTVQIGPTDVRAVDLNSDNAPDLLMVSTNTDQVEVRMNDGSGGYHQTLLYSVGAVPVEVVAADFNADGLLDIVTANSAGGTITVLASGGGCVADLNHDSVLDFFDVAAFLAAFSNHDPSVDFTHDGVFDFFDVAAYLGLFSAGCS